MRKLLLLTGASLMAMALLGPASASALVYDQCDGSPYDNSIAIHDASINTYDSHREGAGSGSLSSGIVCGTDIGYNSGNETYTKFLRIDLPEGVFLRGTDDLPVESVTGHAKTDILNQVGGVPFESYNQNITTKVARTTDEEFRCPKSEATACWENEAPGIGTSWTWKRYKPNPDFPGQEQLVMGPIMIKVIFVGWLPAPAGLVGIDYLNLCRNIGDPDQSDCGGTDDPVQGLNGLSSTGADGCVRGSGKKGIYNLEVERYDGQTTDAQVCVVWLPSDSLIDFAGPLPLKR